MTREQAIKVWRAFGMTKTEIGLRRVHPQRLCNQILDDAAEDEIDGLMALGILKVDPPSIQDDVHERSQENVEVVSNVVSELRLAAELVQHKDFMGRCEAGLPLIAFDEQCRFCGASWKDRCGRRLPQEIADV